MSLVERVQVSHKVRPITRERIDHLSLALKLDKSSILDGAIEHYAQIHREELEGDLRMRTARLDELAPAVPSINSARTRGGNGRLPRP